MVLLTLVCIVMWCVGGDDDGGGGVVMSGAFVYVGGGHLCLCVYVREL